MKARKTVALLIALMMVLALSGVALAIPSPSGYTIVGTSDNAISVAVSSLSAQKRAKLENAAADYILENYGARYSGQTLLAVDLIVNSKDNKPVTFRGNIGGVALGDNIIVVHEKASGGTEIVNASVLSAGLIRFTLNSCSPITIIRINTKGAVTPTMPQTGDNSTAAPMALLLAGCVAVMAVCAKALKKAR